MTAEKKPHQPDFSRSGLDAITVYDSDEILGEVLQDLEKPMVIDGDPHFDKAFDGISADAPIHQWRYGQQKGLQVRKVRTLSEPLAYWKTGGFAEMDVGKHTGMEQQGRTLDRGFVSEVFAFQLIALGVLR